MELQGKKVLVFGSGKSGIGASDLLAKVGAVPVIYDGNADIDKEAVVHKTNGTYPLEIYAGNLPEKVIDSLDLVVLSPGVPTDIPVVKNFYSMFIRRRCSWVIPVPLLWEVLWLVRHM